MLEGCTSWPASDVARFVAQGWWNSTTLAELGRHEPERAGRPAVVTRHKSISWSELDLRADGLAAGLFDLGVRPGDRVVVQLPNVVELIDVLLATFRCGAVPVLALPSHGHHEIGYLVRHTEAVALVVPDVRQRVDYRVLARAVMASSPSLQHVLVAGQAEELVPLEQVSGPPRKLPLPDPAEVALLLLSGGTTGLPKVIPRTHRDYGLQIRETASAMDLDRTGAYLAALPAAHNAALGCPGVLGALGVGATVVLADSPSPDEVFPLMARCGVTLTTLMPALLPVWAEARPDFPVDLSRLVIEVGGAPLDEAVAVASERALGCTITRWFGISEGVLLFTRPTDPQDVRLATEGRPLLPIDEIRVADADDRPVPRGDTGELQLRGPYTLRGYYKSPEENEADFASDGFFRTGDLVRQTPAGDLVVVGRRKDIINRGGEKVAAAELETQLRLHPAVREAAAIALPDPSLGERICAVVVLAAKSDLTLRDLRDFLEGAGLASYKLPDRLVVRSALPHTEVRKIDKKALRDEIIGSGA